MPVDGVSVSVSVRRATREDVPAVLALVRELATYEREPDAVLATEADLLRDGFGERPMFFVDLAYAGGELAGFAFWFFSYSTWWGRPCLYLEDLFVRPEHRKKGAGLALLRALAKEAVAARCRRMVWEVMAWNEPAFRFYESLGAVRLDGWTNMRIDGAALEALAASPPGP